MLALATGVVAAIAAGAAEAQPTRTSRQLPPEGATGGGGDGSHGDRGSEADAPHERGHSGKGRKRPFGPFIYERVDDREAPPEPPTVVVVQPPPEPEAEPEPAPVPLDPGAPGNQALPRGARPAPPGFVVGARLPDNLPQVTLDWRTYGLPEPAPGRLYARVGREVVVLEADSRRVVRILEPGAARR